MLAAGEPEPLAPFVGIPPVGPSGTHAVEQRPRGSCARVQATVVVGRSLEEVGPSGKSLEEA